MSTHARPGARHGHGIWLALCGFLVLSSPCVAQEFGDFRGQSDAAREVSAEALGALSGALGAIQKLEQGNAEGRPQDRGRKEEFRIGEEG